MLNLKIPNKLQWLVGIPIVTFAALGGFSLASTRSMFAHTETVFETTEDFRRSAEQIVHPLNQLRQLSLSIVMAPDRRLQEQLKEQESALTRQLDLTFAGWNPSRSKPVAAAFRELKASWERFKALKDFTIDKALRDYREEAFINAIDPERRQFDVVTENLMHWKGAKAEHARAIYEVARDEFYRNLKILAFVIIVATLIVGVGGLATTRSIVRPLHILTEAAARIARLDSSSADESTRWHESVALAPVARRGDEIGVLARTFQKTVKALQFAHEEMEGRVRDRTTELARANDGLNREVEDRRRAEEELRRGRTSIRTLANSIPQLAWMARPDGNIFWYNQRWFDYTGTTLEQMEGWGWQSVHDPAELPRVVESIKESYASGEPWDCTFPLRRHDGVFRWHLTRMLPVKDEAGRVMLWFGSNTDITEHKQLEWSLREAKEAAEAAARAKGEFLANMSHEIRTPMNGVLGMTELTLATDLSPVQREYVELVRSSAESLLTIINDILDFSKIEAGKFHLDPVPFPLRDTVIDTLRTLALKAHEKGLEVACRIGPEVPETVIGDAGRLRQVLVNLVGNAIKFTEYGEVVVTVAGGCNPASPDELTFAVADTGVGIPSQKRSSIFEAFEQADGSTTRKYGGTGLGLTISARLVQMMNGRIWVEENPGGGSIFRFTAQLDRDLDPQGPREEPSLSVLEGLRVLIIDDNRTNRRILEDVLTGWHCRPSAVESGSAGLDALNDAVDRGDPFSLILLDRMMPEMDGCELAARVHADTRHKGAKILMLTSGGPDDSVRFRELGIGAWLAKPVRQSELLNAILDRLRPPLPQTKPLSIVPTRADPAETGRRLHVLLAEDHPINQKVATRMLEIQGHDVMVVGNGRLAIEALVSRNFDVVLMDVQMPEMDGFVAVEAIRSRERADGGHIPIIALTAHAMAGDRERCLDAGFDDYLSKPIQAAMLREALDRLEE